MLNTKKKKTFDVHTFDESTFHEKTFVLFRNEIDLFKSFFNLPILTMVQCMVRDIHVNKEVA